jgi:hypothetical protein
MRRRDFVFSGLAVAGTLKSRRLVAQPSSAARAAVVVGVNKTGSLPILNAAASGAVTLATWLRSEGFEVKLLVDTSGPVKASDVFDAISELVGRGTLDQLVLYFSGHGFLNGFSETWMLSNAPQNPNEAISVEECVILARESAIPNVVFISDACRSRPDGFVASRVRGSLVFPNSAVSRNARTEVDQFFATLPGSPAYEIATIDSARVFEGIYTSSFMQAFQSPTEEMIRVVKGARVVPNKNLNAYLEAAVAKRAQAKGLTLSQKPEAYILSDENTYIAKVAGTVQDTSLPAAAPGIRDFAWTELKRAGVGDLLQWRQDADIRIGGAKSGSEGRTGSGTGKITGGGAIIDDGSGVGTTGDGGIGAAHQEDFLRAQATLQSASIAAQRPNLSAFVQSETSAGFLVFGKQIADVMTGQGTHAKIVEQANYPSEASKIQVSLEGRPAASVAIRFNDGTGTVLAALRGFNCTVVANELGVADANYRRIGIPPDDRIDRLHMAVAASAQFGVFRIEGDRETISRRARAFGDLIRTGKAADPTLGIYAAYAYAQADLVDEVQSVDRFIRGELQVALLDVAMLGRSYVGDRSSSDLSAFPFCPMLTQGWGLLRVLQIAVAPEVERARDHLRSSLWSTFSPEGMKFIVGALQGGRLR